MIGDDGKIRWKAAVRMMSNAQNTGIFALAERKLAWLDDRQRVLSQNIANADTPGYQSRDVAPFGTVIGNLEISAARTNPLHLAAFSRSSDSGTVQASERAPDGNAVTIEEEMTKVADDETSQALVGNIWHSYMGMYMTALGHGS